MQPDHVLSQAEAQGKMNNKTTLYELCILGLCSSGIGFKIESLRSRTFSWETSEASSWLSQWLYTSDMQIYKQIQEENAKFTVTIITRTDAF